MLSSYARDLLNVSPDTLLYALFWPALQYEHSAMKHNGGEIGKALAKATIHYKQSERGVTAHITDEIDLVNSVIEVVQVMTKLARSNGDLFERKAKAKVPQAVITKLGERFLRAVVYTDVNKIRSHFYFHVFNPFFELFDFHSGKLSISETTICVSDVDKCNACISAIRMEAKSKSFLRKLNDQDRSARKNHASLTQYVRKLRSRHESLIGLHIDLGYLELGLPTPFYSDFLVHRNLFLRNLRKILPHDQLAGYTWKVQITQRKSFHVHGIIFLACPLLGENLAAYAELKQLWEETVPSRQGLCIDCGYETYQFRGLSKNAETDRVAREALRHAITYMTMTDRYIKMTAPQKHRTFGKGTISKKKVNFHGNLAWAEAESPPPL